MKRLTLVLALSMVCQGAAMAQVTFKPPATPPMGGTSTSMTLRWTKAGATDAMAVAMASDGTVWIMRRDGTLSTSRDRGATFVPVRSPMPFATIAAGGKNVVVALDLFSRLWRFADNQWQLTEKGDLQDVAVTSRGRVVMVKKRVIPDERNYLIADGPVAAPQTVALTPDMPVVPPTLVSAGGDQDFLLITNTLQAPFRCQDREWPAGDPRAGQPPVCGPLPESLNFKLWPTKAVAGSAKGVFILLQDGRVYQPGNVITQLASIRSGDNPTQIGLRNEEPVTARIGFTDIAGSIGDVFGVAVDGQLWRMVECSSYAGLGPCSNPK
jgi:hypothetical protein